jgi:hypothetical protein
MSAGQQGAWPALPPLVYCPVAWRLPAGPASHRRPPLRHWHCQLHPARLQKPARSAPAKQDPLPLPPRSAASDWVPPRGHCFKAARAGPAITDKHRVSGNCGQQHLCTLRDIDKGAVRRLRAYIGRVGASGVCGRLMAWCEQSPVPSAPSEQNNAARAAEDRFLARFAGLVRLTAAR